MLIKKLVTRIKTTRVDSYQISASLFKHHKHAVHPNKSPNLIEKQKRIMFSVVFGFF